MLTWLGKLLYSRNNRNLDVQQILSQAKNKLQLLLSKDEVTLKSIFLEIEHAEDGKRLMIAFAKINNYLRFLLRVEPANETYGAVRTALENLETSVKFSSHMKRALSLEDALNRYKTDVVQTLSSHLIKSQEEDIRRGNFDRELIRRYLPQPTSNTKLQEETKENSLPSRQIAKRRKSERDYYPVKQTRSKIYTDHERLRRKNVCISFLHRKCNRGKACKFKHIDY